MAVAVHSRDKPPTADEVAGWESGARRVTWAAVCRYEQLLQLPERQLAAAIDSTARACLPYASGPWLRRPPGPRGRAACTRLLDRAESGRSLTGVDWDDLSAGLVSSSVALLSTHSWRRLLRRGMFELAGALGLEYALRHEALARLAAHPPATEALLGEVRGLVDEPGSPVFSEAISLLRFCAGSQADQLLGELIAAPRNPLVLTAALAVRAAREQEPAATVLDGTVQREAVALLEGQEQTYRVRRASADLLRTAPQRQSLAAYLGPAEDDRAAVAILTGRHPVSAPRRAELTAYVFAELQRFLGQDLREDTELQRRLQILLGSTNEEIRQHTLEVFMLGPLAEPLAAALAQALTDADDRHDLTMMHEALRPLTCLCQPAQLDLLTQLATREPVELGDREVAAEAAWALGNIVEPTGPAAAHRDEALLAALAVARADRPHPGSLPHALLYALALRGQAHRAGPVVAGDPTLTAEVHWWLRLSGVSWLGAISGSG